MTFNSMVNSFIKVIKPKTIDPLTSIDKGEYFLIYKFESGPETMYFNDLNEISKEEALVLMKEFDARVYKSDFVEKFNDIKEFKNNDSTRIVAFGGFLIAALICFGIKK